MRTTLTLDEDVERLLRDSMHRQRQSFRHCVNQALRRGLVAEGKALPPFALEARPMGLRPGFDPARFNQLADQMEIDAAAERMRISEAGGRRSAGRRKRAGR